jgi:hypothetical protein
MDSRQNGNIEAALPAWHGCNGVEMKSKRAAVATSEKMAVFCSAGDQFLWVFTETRGAGHDIPWRVTKMSYLKRSD